MRRGIFLILISLFILNSCHFFKKAGIIGESMSLEESKHRGVFLKEYHLITDICQKITIEEVFVEKGWRYGKRYEETIIDSTLKDFTLIIRSKTLVPYFMNIKLNNKRSLAYVGSPENEILEGYLSNSEIEKDTFTLTVNFVDSASLSTLVFICNKEKKNFRKKASAKLEERK